jgi:uncharacterized membrane protein YebE (DUF533 family)
MATNELKILHAWAAAAWADGKLHPEEKRALHRFIGASSGLTPEERADAEALLESPQQLDAAELKTLGKDEREGIYRAARAIVGLDRTVSVQELEWLARLRGELELDQATLAVIEHPK